MLRTDLFKTRDREETRFIAVRDTRTKLDLGPQDIDVVHCRQGRFGIGYQFLITMDGSIWLGRDIETIGAHSKDYDTISVGVGVVGGKDEQGDANTRTEDQLEALSDLIEFLSRRYPEAEVSDNYPPPKI